MRTYRPIVFLSSILITGFIAGCGGGETEETGSGGSAASDVTGTAVDTFATAAGETKAPVKPTKWTSIEALVEQGGSFKSYPGSIDENGAILIKSVPEGPYWLVLTEPPPEGVPVAAGIKTFLQTSSRSLDLGSLFSHRMDIEPITAPTFVELSASLTQPFQVYTDDGQGNVIQELDDSVQFVAYGANVNGITYGTNPDSLGGAPVNGDMSFNQWTLDASSLFYGIDGRPYLIRTDKKDDLALLHNVASQVEAPAPPAAPDPWASYTYEATRAVFRPAAAVMTNGGTTPMNGSFEALAPVTFSLDYKGSLFTKAMEDGPSADLPDALLSVSVFHEPGAPIPAFGGNATLLSLAVSAITTWVDPTCNPDSCDPAACAAGCSSAQEIVFPGDYARDFSYGNPFTSGQTIADAVLTFRSSVTKLLPNDATPERLQGHVTVRMSADKASGAPLAPVVGFPRNVKINGNAAPVDQVTAGVGTSPDISFEPPSLGTPGGYTVVINALDDIKDGSGAVIRRRQLARFSFTGTSLKVPDGLLEAGKHYFIQVAAVADPQDPAAPFRLKTDYAGAMTYTGVITP